MWSAPNWCSWPFRTTPWPALVDGLAKLGAWQPGQLVAHTSGRFGVGVLHPVAAAGAIPLALHPAMTFTGMSLDLTRLLDCTFGVTADAAMLPIAQALVVEMGGEPVAIAEGDRTLYHAALAHGSNHLVTLVAQASQLLAEVGVDEPGGCWPLLRATLENALASGESALTGPVAGGRGNSGGPRRGVAGVRRRGTRRCARGVPRHGPGHGPAGRKPRCCSKRINWRAIPCGPGRRSLNMVLTWQSGA